MSAFRVDPRAPTVAFLETVRMHPYMLIDAGALDWLVAAVQLAPRLYDNVVMVTSLFDGTHSDESWHYLGKGGDLRWSWKRPGGIDVDHLDLGIEGQLDAQREIARHWCQRIQKALKCRYQVALKDDHIHTEGDPT